MSNKKNNNKSKINNNNFPFSNGVKKLKDEFKKMVDEMSDDDFIDMVSFLMYSSEDFEDEDWTFDEEWENEAEKFYNQGINKSSNFNLDDDNLPF